MSKSLKNLQGKSDKSKQKDTIQQTSKNNKEKEKEKEKESIKENKSTKEEANTNKEQKRDGIPRNVNAYSHFLKVEYITEQDIEWVLKLRNPDIELKEKLQHIPN